MMDRMEPVSMRAGTSKLSKLQNKRGCCGTEHGELANVAHAGSTERSLEGKA